MLIGYMRVSTGEQNPDLQRDALERAGCERIYDDVCSGRATERPGLAKALDVARDGDALVVWKLDRIGRSLTHVVGLVSDLQKRRVGLKVLTGRLVFGIFATLAEFERDLIHERTIAGCRKTLLVGFPSPISFRQGISARISGRFGPMESRIAERAEIT